MLSFGQTFKSALNGLFVRFICYTRRQSHIWCQPYWISDHFLAIHINHTAFEKYRKMLMFLDVAWPIWSFHVNIMCSYVKNISSSMLFFRLLLIQRSSGVFQTWFNCRSNEFSCCIEQTILLLTLRTSNISFG